MLVHTPDICSTADMVAHHTCLKIYRVRPHHVAVWIYALLCPSTGLSVSVTSQYWHVAAPAYLFVRLCSHACWILALPPGACFACLPCPRAATLDTCSHLPHPKPLRGLCHTPVCTPVMSQQCSITVCTPVMSWHGWHTCQVLCHHVEAWACTAMPPGSTGMPVQV